MKLPASFQSSKRLLAVLAVLLGLIALLGGVKALQIRALIAQKKQFTPPPETVTTSVAQLAIWEMALRATGSLIAVQGVTVAAELPGKVVRIPFTPGTRVKAGELLVQQDTSSEEAQLRAAETAATLAKTNLERYRGLLATSSIAQVTFDSAEAQYKETAAVADTIRATIAKKQIRAPFAGRLGIRLVNLGQILKEGEAVVTLQALDPIFVNFLLPQQELPLIKTGLTVRLTTDTQPGRTIQGLITTINPEVDSATRNIRVQATVMNADEALRPGMFADVAVVLPGDRTVLAIPATAVLYAPYSDSVFVVEDKKDEKNGQAGKVVRQQFVRLGDKRGDFVAVVSGLTEGDTVVSTGVFKLRNGQAVKVDNTLAPEFKLAPKPDDA